MEKKYCVIGDPIAHSLSPDIYTELFAHYGLPGCSYFKEQVTVQTLPEFIGGLRARGICGFNITMPLKQAVLPYLNYMDPSAAYGANTVVVEETQGLAGWSTDAAGFVRSLHEHGHSFLDADVVFIGCGGAAKTLIRAAAKEARSITILNRTPDHAQAFASLPGVKILPLSNIGSQMNSCNLLINATPLGMSGIGADFEDLSFLAKLPEGAFVCDLIYDPPMTAFLTEAERLGHATMNGLWMLIWQACYAFEKFTGIMPDLAAFNAVKAVLGRQRQLPQ
ncbi:MAG: shikimate dehydrogenase [Clostridia bacterium]|nr:shikimate dehydrogenase [Clostridia bacterium]